MNIFGIGLPEMAVIAAIGLLVFGPKRLPELGKTLGRTLRGFQSASQEFEKEFRTAIGSEGGGEALQEGGIPGPPQPEGSVATTTPSLPAAAEAPLADGSAAAGTPLGDPPLGDAALASSGEPGRS
jgi:sec-independent protein translocase protein TatA